MVVLNVTTNPAHKDTLISDLKKKNSHHWGRKSADDHDSVYISSFKPACSRLRQRNHRQEQSHNKTCNIVRNTRRNSFHSNQLHTFYGLLHCNDLSIPQTFCKKNNKNHREGIVVTLGQWLQSNYGSMLGPSDVSLVLSTYA